MAAAEKNALLAEALAVQHTMVDLSKRIHAVDKENAALEEENEVLKEYIDNLMGKLGDNRDQQSNNAGNGGGSGSAGARR